MTRRRAYSLRSVPRGPSSSPQLGGPVFPLKSRHLLADKGHMTNETNRETETMASIIVYLCAFRYKDEPVGIREVEIPEDHGKPGWDLAELAFYYGQNDILPVPGVRSVSCGDVVELPDGRLMVVKGVGFSELKGTLAAHAEAEGISRDY